MRNEEGNPFTDELFVLTQDILYKCNYGSTVEGLLANKMLVDTIFEAPDWFPFWVKVISFFFVTYPMIFITAVDDALGSYIVYNRLKIHGQYGDAFDFGIIAGKISRIGFQIYLLFVEFQENFYWLK